MASIIKEVIIEESKILQKLTVEDLIKKRMDKYNNIGHISSNEWDNIKIW